MYSSTILEIVSVSEVSRRQLVPYWDWESRDLTSAIFFLQKSRHATIFKKKPGQAQDHLKIKVTNSKSLKAGKKKIPDTFKERYYLENTR